MHGPVAAVWLLGFTVAAGTVLGQERFTLTEDDTWQPVGSIDPATPEGQLALARRELAGEQPRRAERLAGAWIERHARHPLLGEAYLVRGDALKAQGRYYQALFDYEFVARGFPASEAFVTALEREFAIARLFAGGTRRKLLGLRIVDASDEAEELLILIQERLPGSRLAEQAGIELADFYFRRRKMDLAVEMYSIFLENHPSSEHVSKARRRLIYAHLATFKGPEFDATGLREARVRLQELIRLEPAAAERIGAEALLTRIDESNARKLLLTAQWSLRTGDPIAAELTIRRLLRRYPRTVAATDALRFIEKILPELPASVLNEAPDYKALRQAILGGEAR
ncbi:MAG: outer membrane protein assembly factor BamD [Planctomycetota bacterium]|jgi:outer membrane protein assembly factor BamD (BamD/ComL family)